MEDDFDLEETSGQAPQEPEPVDVAKLQSALAKANKEALEARLELKRVKLEKDYGEEIVQLIPPTLPQTEWGEYAEKLKAFRGQPSSETQTEPATEPEAETAPSAEEAKLAAVTQGPVSGASPAPTDYTAKELLEMAKTDPVLAQRLVQAKYGGT